MKPLPWSHSAKGDFLNCAKQYYEKRVAKSVVELPNEAGDWGNYVHKNFEKYLKGEITTLPGNLAPYRDYLDTLANAKGRMLVECQYAINREMQPCDWLAPDVWCRGIVDVLYLHGQQAMAIDHKTGKQKEDFEQLKLNALLIFIHHPEIIAVRCAYSWLKTDQVTTAVFLRSDEAELWEDFLPFLKAYQHAFKTGTFPPRPSGLCNGWCPVTSCSFWRPKRAGR